MVIFLLAITLQFKVVLLIEDVPSYLTIRFLSKASTLSDLTQTNTNLQTLCKFERFVSSNDFFLLT